MKKMLICALGSLLLSGCAVHKQMTPMGGSKADGTVKMGYSYSILEVPTVDMEQASAAAANKCKIWGYEGAEPFGGQTKQCAEPSGGGCEQFDVFVEFQCTGGRAAEH
ncbi:YecR family lipoprotein [Enterobacter sp.]|uniref:YecR family lipoprotein n=1 Tax=Enterobacter sp. TaxID=42895 RepID=UPI00296F2631|nr:YecR family lipoprotein [Enterobacter sp.]